MEVGIIGFEGAGKKTLFSLLTGVAPDAFSKGKGSVGVVNVPDERVDYLAGLCSSKKKTYTKITFNLLDSLQKDSEDTKKILANAKLADMYMVVLRQFSDKSVYHPLGEVDLKRDYSMVMDELMLSDLLLIDTRLTNIDKQLKKLNEQALVKEKEILERFKATLEKGLFLSAAAFSAEDFAIVKSLSFITIKPIFVAVNCDEDKIHDKFDLPKDISYINISAKIETEIQQLDEKERNEFLASLRLEEPCLNRLIKFAYSFGNLISFLTMGPDESRSWTIRSGTAASKAASVIHSDIEKGFIRAEVLNFNDLKTLGSVAEARNKGLYRLEGRDYVIRDGDIVEFRFNV